MYASGNPTQASKRKSSMLPGQAGPFVYLDIFLQCLAATAEAACSMMKFGTSERTMDQEW
jgi:hypothetical protein